MQLDLLQTGQGSHQRKMMGDLRKEVLNLLESLDPGNKGLRMSELLDALSKQSSIVSPPRQPTLKVYAFTACGNVGAPRRHQGFGRRGQRQGIRRAGQAHSQDGLENLWTLFYCRWQRDSYVVTARDK
jgi:hypothetical protein